MINLRKLAEQQKEQRAIKINNRILKQTNDFKLGESLSPITKKLDEVKKTTQELGEIVEESKPETPQLAIANTQTPVIANTSTSNSLGDPLSIMKTSKNFFRLEENDGKVFRNKIPIQAMGENRISIKDQDYDFKLNFQEYFTNTKLTTINMDDEDKSTVYDILENTGFYSMKHIKGSNSARMKDALTNFPREIGKIQNPFLPAIENESDNLQGEGLKIVIPSNIIDIYTRLEVLLGLKLSGYTDTLTEASNLVDELYKRGEIRNKQRRVLYVFIYWKNNNFSNI